MSSPRRRNRRIGRRSRKLLIAFVTPRGESANPAGKPAESKDSLREVLVRNTDRNSTLYTDYQYKKGSTVPTGETEFNFQVGNMNFHSTAYTWLVVSGYKAQYKGTGTINGSGSYSFTLTAYDGDITGGGGVDKFRIQITDNNHGNGVVFDNRNGVPIDMDTADPQAIAGGSIVIHKV